MMEREERHQTFLIFLRQRSNVQKSNLQTKTCDWNLVGVDDLQSEVFDSGIGSKKWAKKEVVRATFDHFQLIGGVCASEV